MRAKFADEETCDGDTCGTVDCQFQNPCDAFELLCAEVVSGDWLHALVESHHNHHEEKSDTVGNAVCADVVVAAVFGQSLVDEDDDEAGCQVHQEG